MAATLTIALLVGCAGEPEPAGESARVVQRGEPGAEKVILVVIDTLRADHLGVHGYARDTSPTIDRLAREGVHLPHLVVQAPHTAPSVASILTGTLPAEHGVQYHGETKTFTGRKKEVGAPVLAERSVTLAEWLARRGYFTGAVVTNPWLAAAHGFGQGFAEYRELDCYRPRARRRARQGEGRAAPAESRASCDGARVNELAEELLRAHAGERTFLYLHYMDVHSPYAHDGALPARWRGARGRDAYRGNGPAPGVSAENLAFTQALYDEGIAYTDALVARLLRFLETEKLLAGTTLVVTTDHGEEFLEHGGLGHGTSLHHEQLQGFGVLWRAAVAAPRRIEQRVAAVDLFPTLLALIGIDAPTQIAGRNALAPDAAAPRDVVAELADSKALLRGAWKLVLGVRSQRARFSRVDVAGAELGSDGAASPPEAATMRAALDQVIRRAVSSTTGELDADARAELRALGYLD